MKKAISRKRSRLTMMAMVLCIMMLANSFLVFANEQSADGATDSSTQTSTDVTTQQSVETTTQPTTQTDSSTSDGSGVESTTNTTSGAETNSNASNEDTISSSSNTSSGSSSVPTSEQPQLPPDTTVPVTEYENHLPVETLPVASNYVSSYNDSCLMYLPFNGTFDGANGERAKYNDYTKLVEGFKGKGVNTGLDGYLSYESKGRVNLDKGTVEFYIKPNWNGDDKESYNFFEVGKEWFNRMRVMKDGGDNLRFIVWDSYREFGIHYNVSHWRAGEWHHVAASWKDRSIALFVDGKKVASSNTAHMPEKLGDTITIGVSNNMDQQANATIDEVVISRFSLVEGDTCTPTQVKLPEYRPTPQPKPIPTPMPKKDVGDFVKMPLYVNDKEIQMSAPIFKNKNGFLVALRDTNNVFGLKIQMAEDGKGIKLFNEQVVVKMLLESNFITFNNHEVRSVNAPTVLNGMAYVPLNILGEYLGYKVKHDGKRIHLYHKDWNPNMNKPKDEDKKEDKKEGDISLFLNDKKFNLSAPLHKERDGFMISLRDAAQLFRFEAGMAPDGSGFKLKNDKFVIKMAIDSDEIIYNDRNIRTNIPPKVVAGRVYIPLNQIAEIQGYIVKFDGKSIHIYFKEYVKDEQKEERKQEEYNYQNEDTKDVYHEEGIEIIKPINLEARSRGNSVYLKWYIPENSDKKVKGFNIYRGMESGVYSEEPITDFNIKEFEYLDKNVKMGQRYFYICKIVFEDKTESAPSNEAKIDLRGTQIVLKIGEPIMKINGQEKAIDENAKVSPVVYNGRTLLPVRALITALGGNVDWYAPERKVTISYKDTILELFIDKTVTRLNGVEEETDVAPQIMDGRTMLPLRYITTKLNCEVDWDSETSSVTILQ